VFSGQCQGFDFIHVRRIFLNSYFVDLGDFTSQGNLVGTSTLQIPTGEADSWVGSNFLPEPVRMIDNQKPPNASSGQTAVKRQSFRRGWALLAAHQR
jgi:hypothetical protein